MIVASFLEVETFQDLKPEVSLIPQPYMKPDIPSHGMKQTAGAKTCLWLFLDFGMVKAIPELNCTSHKNFRNSLSSQISETVHF